MSTQFIGIVVGSSTSTLLSNIDKSHTYMACEAEEATLHLSIRVKAIEAHDLEVRGCWRYRLAVGSAYHRTNHTKSYDNRKHFSRQWKLSGLVPVAVVPLFGTWCTAWCGSRLATTAPYFSTVSRAHDDHPCAMLHVWEGADPPAPLPLLDVPLPIKPHNVAARGLLRAGGRGGERGGEGVIDHTSPCVIDSLSLSHSLDPSDFSHPQLSVVSSRSTSSHLCLQ